jgi:hypothetical protein
MSSTSGWWSSPSAHLRASDAERERVVAFLRDHCAQGRLTPDELELRIQRAYAAVTLGDLGGLVADLPGSPLPAAPPRRSLRTGELWLPAALLVAALALPGLAWMAVGVAIALSALVLVAAIALGVTVGPGVLLLVAAVLLLRHRRRRWAGGLRLR